MKGGSQPERADVCADLTPPVTDERHRLAEIQDEDISILIRFFKTLDQWDRDAENPGKVV